VFQLDIIIIFPKFVGTSKKMLYIRYEIIEDTLKKSKNPL